MSGKRAAVVLLGVVLSFLFWISKANDTTKAPDRIICCTMRQIILHGALK